MFSSVPVLLALFLAAAAAIWVAGIHLSKTTDVLSERLHLGTAIGGLILLALATNLPEIAITASAALQHQLGIAIGNILGGIAIQTVVLVVLDVFGLGRRHALSYVGSSLQIVLEGGLVIAVLVVAVMGAQLPASATHFRLEPAAILITALWVVGLWLLSRARTGLPWHEKGDPPDGQNAPRGTRKKKREQQADPSTTRAAVVFAIAALVTLIGGVVLERSGERLAGHIGMTGVLFGATVLAAATSLPEVSTGIASVKMGDYQLAFSDIFGGNAFLPVLFLVASLLSGSAVLPQAQKTDIYLTALGALLTAVYIYGLIFRSRRLVARMGLDSLVVLVLYAVGLVGLVLVTRS
ncbi:MAG: sodium:calcium antiporter [Gaiellaceae bacterium]